MLPASDKTLARWYLKFKEKYFQERIPELHRVSLNWEHPNQDDVGFIIEQEPGLFVIKCDPSFRAMAAHGKIVLLHECAHLEVWPTVKHGKRFNEVIDRLYAEGAYKGLL